MPKTRPPYPPEFRRQMVDLVRDRPRSPEELPRSSNRPLNRSAIGLRQADGDEGRRPKTAR